MMLRGTRNRSAGPQGKAGPGRKGRGTKATPPGARILVIDDDPHTRAALAAGLRGAGYAVEEAEGGVAGLALLSEVPVDLVLTALDMPGVSGWDVARTVRAWQPELPVVAFSEQAGARAADLRERGFVIPVLEEPCDLPRIQKLVSQLGTIRRATPTPGAAQAGSGELRPAAGPCGISVSERQREGSPSSEERGE
jgi:two-component system, NarL family, capsular synthesis sensor histidine kinase RcsC